MLTQFAPRYLLVDLMRVNRDPLTSRNPHQGDRKGPHSAQLLPRPYNDYEEFFTRQVSV